MGKKCTLQNDELIVAVQEWVSKLCETGGRAWAIRVPVDFNRDPDMLITELCQRFTALREAVAWHLEYDQFFDWMWDQIGDYDDEWPCEEEMFAGHWTARAEVDRLIANESSADCEGEG